MPVIKCSHGKYRIGSGACIYDTEESAQRAWAAIRVSMVNSYNDYPKAAILNAQKALNIRNENKSTCGTPVGSTAVPTSVPNPASKLTSEFKKTISKRRPSDVRERCMAGNLFPP